MPEMVPAAISFPSPEVCFSLHGDRMSATAGFAQQVVACGLPNDDAWQTNPVRAAGGRGPTPTPWWTGPSAFTS